jgi:ATP-dependent Clp protease protease subunit
MKKYENYSAEERAEVSLYDNDVHYLNGEITEDNVSKAIKWILSANLNKKPKRTLTLYVNTVGGDLYESFALIDVMRNSHHHVSTIGIGAVMSAGFLIFASGKQGERYIGKNTGILNHQHSDTMESKMHDMKAQMKENNNCEQRCMQILRDATGYSLVDVRKKFNNPSDQYFTAKQLVDLKIADHIL